MTPAAVGVAMFALGVLVGIPAGFVWCRHEEREDRQRARDDKQVLCDAITRLEAEVASLRPAPLHYKLTCGICGPLVVSTDLIAEPLTDEQFATALEVLLTEHAIAAHLDEVAG